MVFCGDFLRPDLDGAPHQRLNARLLARVFAGLGALFADCAVVADEIAGEPLAAVYRRLYPAIAPDPVTAWASLYHAQILPAPIEHLIERTTRDSVTVIFEGSPTLLACLDRLGRPWIDVRVDPRRFLADLLLSVRTSDPALMAPLASAALDAEFLAAEVAYVRARHFYQAATLPPDAIVVLAQVAGDASLIGPAGLSRPADFADRIAALTSGRPVFVKPHPYDTDHIGRDAWTALVPGALPLERNFYELLAVEPPFHVLTMASGGADEAVLFGHRAIRLLPVPRPGAALLHDYWYPGFWRWLLRDGGAARPLPPFVPDRLRRVINLDWSKRF